MTVFRLCSDLYSAESGEGAAKNGGRWNLRGIAVIYAASTASLAALEILANVSFLPSRFTVTEIELPDSVIEQLSNDILPTDWDAAEPIAATRELGGRWASEARSAALSVPSSVVRTERNYVINPAHPDFASIKFLTPQPFRFDPRLKPPPGDK